MRFVLALVLLGSITATAELARAQDASTEGQGAEQRVIYKKKTVIDLTGAIIEGELTRPEGSYVVARKVSRFSSLIHLRGDFWPELLASPEQL